jgi:hypothetical protein
MRAVTGESVFPESGEEKRLWNERAQLEWQIEKKEKMIHNTRERLKTGWRVCGEQTLNDEAEEIQREISELREEITLVDREIRVAEKDASVEGLEEKATEVAAKEAKEYALRLGEARQRMEAEARIISELEGKLKHVGKM